MTSEIRPSGRPHSSSLLLECSVRLHTLASASPFLNHECLCDYSRLTIESVSVYLCNRARQPHQFSVGKSTAKAKTYPSQRRGWLSGEGWAGEGAHRTLHARVRCRPRWVIRLYFWDGRPKQVKAWTVRRPAQDVVLAGSVPCAHYADLRLGSSDPSYVRSGAAKPHDVPSVIFTAASQGKRYFPASMSCI